MWYNLYIFPTTSSKTQLDFTKIVNQWWHHYRGKITVMFLCFCCIFTLYFHYISSILCDMYGGTLFRDQNLGERNWSAPRANSPRWRESKHLSLWEAARAGRQQIGPEASAQGIMGRSLWEAGWHTKRLRVREFRWGWGLSQKKLSYIPLTWQHSTDTSFYWY